MQIHHNPDFLPQQLRQITPISEIHPLALPTAFFLVLPFAVEHPVVPLRAGYGRREPDLLVGRLFVDDVGALRGERKGDDAGLGKRKRVSNESCNVGKVWEERTLYSTSTSSRASCIASAFSLMASIHASAIAWYSSSSIAVACVGGASSGSLCGGFGFSWSGMRPALLRLEIVMLLEAGDCHCGAAAAARTKGSLAVFSRPRLVVVVTPFLAAWRTRREAAGEDMAFESGSR